MVNKNKSALRLLGRAFVLLILFLSAIGAGLIGYYNRSVDVPGQEELSASYDEAADWLEHNRDAILDVPNPILWYMLQSSLEHHDDPRVRSLFEDYLARYVEPVRYKARSPIHIWLPMFYPEVWVPFKYEEIRNFTYYNKHFAYALSCKKELGNIPEIAEQNLPGFCGNFYILKPTCVTHQLMGIRFLQRSSCGEPGEVEAVVEALQSRVVTELTYDPRVVDVYIQRVMMLLESGKPELVKPVWIRRVLDAQLADGGWGNFITLVPLWGDKYFGYGHGGSKIGVPAGSDVFRFRGVGIGESISTFHATAQGILMLALLIK